jgi:hypothetical protein
MSRAIPTLDVTQVMFMTNRSVAQWSGGVEIRFVDRSFRLFVAQGFNGIQFGGAHRWEKAADNANQSKNRSGNQ